MYKIFSRERQLLYSFFIKPGELCTVELLGTSENELGQMAALYQIGFSQGPPLSREEHKHLAEKGDVIGIRQRKDGKLIAMRAMVYHRDHTNRFDKQMLEHHAYQNHTVIDPAKRGQGLFEKLTEEAIKLAIGRGKQAILSTVSPNNIANLRALTRQGYRVITFAPNHFEDNTDWYIVECDITETRARLTPDFYTNLFSTGQIAPYSQEGDNDYYFIPTTSTDLASDLLSRKYQGVSTIIDNENKYLVFEKSNLVGPLSSKLLYAEQQGGIK